MHSTPGGVIYLHPPPGEPRTRPALATLPARGRDESESEFVAEEPPTSHDVGGLSKRAGPQFAVRLPTTRLSILLNSGFCSSPNDFRAAVRTASAV